MNGTLRGQKIDDALHLRREVIAAGAAKMGGEHRNACGAAGIDTHKRPASAASLPVLPALRASRVAPLEALREE